MASLSQWVATIAGAARQSTSPNNRVGSYALGVGDVLLLGVGVGVGVDDS